MFKKKRLIFYIADMDAIDFCRILGKYGAKFEIGERRESPRSKITESSSKEDYIRKQHYRIFTVYISKHKSADLQDELMSNHFI